MGILAAITNHPAILWLKLAGVVGIAAASAYGAWQFRGIDAEVEKRNAVEEAIKDVQDRLVTERKLRATYQKLADEKLDVLLKSISAIKVEHTEITNNIMKEREIHKEFYVQPMPEGGYDQWKRARALVEGSSKSASSP